MTASEPGRPGCLPGREAGRPGCLPASLGDWLAVACWLAADTCCVGCCFGALCAMALVIVCSILLNIDHSKELSLACIYQWPCDIALLVWPLCVGHCSVGYRIWDRCAPHLAVFMLDGKLTNRNRIERDSPLGPQVGKPLFGEQHCVYTAVHLCMSLMHPCESQSLKKSLPIQIQILRIPRTR